MKSEYHASELDFASAVAGPHDGLSGYTVSSAAPAFAGAAGGYMCEGAPSEGSTAGPMSKCNSNTAAGGDLGGVLYGERRHITPAVMYTGLGAAFLLVGLLCSFARLPPPAPPHGMRIVGLLVALGGALCLGIGLVRLIPNMGASWHLHERGIRLLQRGKERVLRYEEVDELTLKVVRVFFHDVCTGDVHEATFTGHGPPRQAVHIKQVRRPRTVSGADLDQPGELAQACDTIAGLIARRMLARMGRGEAVAWVRSIRLLPDGLEIGSSRTGPLRIAWNQVDRVRMEQGNFYLWRRGETQPILQIPTHLPNLFPGYQVILDRMQQGCKPEADDA
jgi:hypothetical protein